MSFTGHYTIPGIADMSTIHNINVKFVKYIYMLIFGKLMVHPKQNLQPKHVLVIPESEHSITYVKMVKHLDDH
jgi:hypothetical protein